MLRAPLATPTSLATIAIHAKVKKLIRTLPCVQTLMQARSHQDRTVAYKAYTCLMDITRLLNSLALSDQAQYLNELEKYLRVVLPYDIVFSKNFVCLMEMKLTCVDSGNSAALAEDIIQQYKNLFARQEKVNWLYRVNYLTFLEIHHEDFQEALSQGQHWLMECESQQMLPQATREEKSHFYHVLAIAAYATGKNKLAMEYVNKGIAVDFPYAPLYSMRGKCYQLLSEKCRHKGNIHKLPNYTLLARKDYERAREIDGQIFVRQTRGSHAIAKLDPIAPPKISPDLEMRRQIFKIHDWSVPVREHGQKLTESWPALSRAIPGEQANGSQNTGPLPSPSLCLQEIMAQQSQAEKVTRPPTMPTSSGAVKASRTAATDLEGVPVQDKVMQLSASASEFIPANFSLFSHPPRPIALSRDANRPIRVWQKKNAQSFGLSDEITDPDASNTGYRI